MTDTQQPPPENNQEPPVLTPPNGDEEHVESVVTHPIPVLSPPDGNEETKSDNRFQMLLLGVALVVLLGFAVIMVWVLPFADREQSVTSGPEENLQEKPLLPAEENGPDRLTRPAEEILGDWFRIQAVAEAGVVSEWGAESYQS